MTKASLLRKGSLPPEVSFCVYLQDHPGPIAEDVVYRVVEGASVIIVDERHDTFFSAVLPDMLLSGSGWVPQAGPPAVSPPAALVVTDLGPFVLDPLPDDADLCSEIAPRLRVAAPVVFAWPAAARPPFLEHRGFSVCSLSSALRGASRGAGGAPMLSVILDLRRIWLGFVVATADTASLSLASVRRQLQPLCPPGFGVSVGCARLAGLPVDGSLALADGEVIDVAFLCLPDGFQAASVSTEHPSAAAVRRSDQAFDLASRMPTIQKPPPPLDQQGSLRGELPPPDKGQGHRGALFAYEVALTQRLGEQLSHPGLLIFVALAGALLCLGCFQASGCPAHALPPGLLFALAGALRPRDRVLFTFLALGQFLPGVVRRCRCQACTSCSRIVHTPFPPRPEALDHS